MKWIVIIISQKLLWVHFLPAVLWHYCHCFRCIPHVLDMISNVLFVIGALYIYIKLQCIYPNKCTWWGHLGKWLQLLNKYWSVSHSLSHKSAFVLHYFYKIFQEPSLVGVSSRAASILKVGLISHGGWLVFCPESQTALPLWFPKEPWHHKITSDPYTLKRVA